MTPHYILAVDPATKAGWALFEYPSTYLESGMMDFSKARSLYWATEQLYNIGLDKDLFDGGSRMVLVLEEPWGRFFRSSRKQAEYLALFEVVYGYDRVIRVNPATWQTQFLHVSTRLGRKKIKGVAQRVAAVVADKPLGEDEADAICIGLWAAATLRLEEYEQKKERGRKIKRPAKG